MAGGSKEYSGGLPMNSIEFFKVSTISMGVTNPKDPDEYEIHSFQDIQNYQYRKIVLKNNQLVGAVLVGSVDRAGIFAGLIREKVDMTPFKESLLLPDFGFVNLSREIRNRLFGPLGKTVDSGQARKSAGH